MCIRDRFYPYSDNMILEFHKDGTFKGARNVYHFDDNYFVDEDMQNNMITKTLKGIFAKRARK